MLWDVLGSTWLWAILSRDSVGFLEILIGQWSADEGWLADNYRSNGQCGGSNAIDFLIGQHGAVDVVDIVDPISLSLSTSHFLSFSPHPLASTSFFFHLFFISSRISMIVNYNHHFNDSLTLITSSTSINNRQHNPFTNLRLCFPRYIRPCSNCISRPAEWNFKKKSSQSTEKWPIRWPSRVTWRRLIQSPCLESDFDSFRRQTRPLIECLIIEQSSDIAVPLTRRNDRHLSDAQLNYEFIVRLLDNSIESATVGGGGGREGGWGKEVAKFE